MYSTSAAGLCAFDVQGGMLWYVRFLDDPTKRVIFSHTTAGGRVYFTLSEIESDIWALDLEW